MAAKPKPQFTSAESAHLKDAGRAFVGDPTPFDEETQEHLADHFAHEASAGKERAAQTGGSIGLGPSAMDRVSIQQRAALAQQAATQGAVQAAKAQAAQSPVNAPPALGGAVGSTIPFPAQKDSQGQPGGPISPPGPMPPPPAAPGGSPPPDQGEPEEEEAP
jgi:hypothetical protein